MKLQDNELKVRLKAPMLNIKNGMIAETNSSFPQGEAEETSKHSIKKIGNSISCVVSPFSILGWLRHGITEFLISKGISTCHSYDLSKNLKEETANWAEQDLARGYHRKLAIKKGNKADPECVSIKGTPCIVCEMFGNFTGQHRTFSLMPVKISPVESRYSRGVGNITGRGNYRNLNISPRSHTDGSPFNTFDVDVIANFDAILYIKMYESNLRLKEHVAMIYGGIKYLKEHQNDFNHQLGGARTSGCGFIDPTFLPTTMTRKDVIKHHNTLISMEDKDEDTKTTQSDWEKTDEPELNEILKNVIEEQKKFGFQKDITGKIINPWWDMIIKRGRSDKNE